LTVVAGCHWAVVGPAASFTPRPKRRLPDPCAAPVRDFLTVPVLEVVDDAGELAERLERRWPPIKARDGRRDTRLAG